MIFARITSQRMGFRHGGYINLVEACGGTNFLSSNYLFKPNSCLKQFCTEANQRKELHSRENKEYIVKCNDDRKIVVSGNYGIRNEFSDALNGRACGGLGLVRKYLTSVGAGNGMFILKLCISELYSVLKNLCWRLFHSEALHKGTSYAKKGMDVETKDEEELIDIKEGDIINLPDLLFTKNRDYLVKYNGQKVKAEQMVGKAILLYFVLVCQDDCLERDRTTLLIDIYNDLLPKNNFEVIIVAVDELTRVPIDLRDLRDPRKNFKSKFARMPWTAIPFSDKASRKRIARRFGVSKMNSFATYSVSLDSKGMVLKCDACYFFEEYGTRGYPFTDERIKFLDSEDDAAAKQPSLELLLSSPERDYVISNKGEKVPIHTLKDKVVALYFYEDCLTHYNRTELTLELTMIYKELAKNKENFEVVLLYLYDTFDTLGCTNEESFWELFKTMPWLALPYRDPNVKKLKRIFGYTYDLSGPERAPTLTIIGPNVEFVDSCGADIVMKFGTPAYPFTRKNLAKLETEMIKELKLEMLWDPNTVFRVKKDGLEIPFSQFAGKRLLIYFEIKQFRSLNPPEKLLMMKDLYLKMKGTDDEFEVIYIKDVSTGDEPDGSRFLDEYGELPWLAHNYYDKGYSFTKDLEHILFHFNYYHVRKRYHNCLLAFDRDGSIVRKTFLPSFDDVEFPFYAGGMEKEFLEELNTYFGWYYWDYVEQEHYNIYRRG